MQITRYSKRVYWRADRTWFDRSPQVAARSRWVYPPGTKPGCSYAQSGRNNNANQQICGIDRRCHWPYSRNAFTDRSTTVRGNAC